MLVDVLDAIARKKARLDRLRPLRTDAIAQLQKHYDVELTYTSNAIEGNMLTLRETAEVVEHGVTVGGKSLREHLEAVDHYEALLWMRDLAAETTPIDDNTVCELHRRIVARSQPGIAGIYSRNRRLGRDVSQPAKVPLLMEKLGEWLRSAAAEPLAAFEAHFRLTAIHPFADGNGRTARLLMNLLLIRGGYPPLAVRPEDRKAYLDGLERASLAEDAVPYRTFMCERLDATLADYIGVLEETLPPSPDSNSV